MKVVIVGQRVIAASPEMKANIPNKSFSVCQSTPISDASVFRKERKNHHILDRMGANSAI